MNHTPSEPETTINVKRASLRRMIFGPPRLPMALVWTAVFAILSMTLLILNNQRIDYWFDFSLGYVGSPWLNEALQTDPLLFSAICVGYGVIIYLLLRFLHFQIAIIIWAAATFFHVRDIIVWTQCALGKFFPSLELRCGGATIGLSVFFAALLGVVMAASLRSIYAPVVSTRRSRLVFPLTLLTSVWFLGLFAWLVWNWFVPVEGWIPIAVDNPPPARVSAAIAYDSGRETAVLFGGGHDWQGANWYDYLAFNDTWLWDGNDWVQQTPTVAPPARFSHQMAYDPIRERVVLFGGQTNQISLDDTWEWDGETWHEIQPINSPPARCCHVMFFDTQRGKVVLSSGLQTPQYFLTDLWEWDGENWTQIINESYQPQFSGYASAYSADTAMGVVLGNSETWTWRDGQWTSNQTPDISCRTDASMAYDPRRRIFVLYGGQNPTDNCYYHDTWAFDGQSWTEAQLENTPGSLSRHTMFYDQKRRSIMIFGGMSGGNAQNRLWGLYWPNLESE